MSYASVDKLQNLLADEVFHYTTDKKKASGRALGTFIEIITYYLLKNWSLESFVAIERPLPEYANDDITHNVEFTLHGNKTVLKHDFKEEDIPISGAKLKKIHPQIIRDESKRSIMLIDKSKVIRNACTISNFNRSFMNVYLNNTKNEYAIYELTNRPFAMFECKRVGIEEGTKKGPQTIEKAKQGSYVAKTVSSLQKIRRQDGSIGGLILKDGGNYIIDDYYKLLNKVIASNDAKLLRHFILTVGIVSNHGNWFTSENPNKELRVLAQSYDWLIFLTDTGITEFITDLLLNPQKKYIAVKNAFDASYNSKKKGNIFTKVKMDFSADKALNKYFRKNQIKIENWFNVISPTEGKLSTLKIELKKLSQKNWWKVYS